MSGLASALYVGTVQHRRHRPARHRLRYGVFMLLLDLDELERLDRDFSLFGYNRTAALAFYDRDHGDGSGRPLRPQIEAQLAEAGIALDGGAVRILCMPRLLGYVFNPLSIYYCHRPDGALAAVIYEVSNTFGQRHSYVMPVRADGAKVVRHGCDKHFYVSPFIPMEAHYAFRLVLPGEDLAVVIRETDAQGPLLDASFVARRRPLSGGALARVLARFPLMTLKVMAAIHWEALKLWLKGARFHRRPPGPDSPTTIVPLAD